MQVIYGNCKKNSTGPKKNLKSSLPLKRVHVLLACMTVDDTLEEYFMVVSHGLTRRLTLNGAGYCTIYNGVLLQ